MNDFAVIANTPFEHDGRRYETGDAVTLQADACAPLLVLGTVRLTTTIAPKRRGRPRKPRETEAPVYQRRDMQAEE